MTVMRIRAVADERYRYIRNFTPDTPFLAYNAYKEKQYPVWTLLPKLHKEGKLTARQAFLSKSCTHGTLSVTRVVETPLPTATQQCVFFLHSR
jgi:hypothetical protein